MNCLVTDWMSNGSSTIFPAKRLPDKSSEAMYVSPAALTSNSDRVTTSPVAGLVAAAGAGWGAVREFLVDECGGEELVLGGVGLRDEEAEAWGDGEGCGGLGGPAEGGEDCGAGVVRNERGRFGVAGLEERAGCIDGGREEDAMEVALALAGDGAVGRC